MKQQVNLFYTTSVPNDAVIENCETQTELSLVIDNFLKAIKFNQSFDDYIALAELLDNAKCPLAAEFVRKAEQRRIELGA
jgi:hypothetical protein